MTKIRAKMTVSSVEKQGESAERLNFHAIYTGTKEDNSFSAATPSASLDMTISNPELIGKFKAGDKFYIDFTPTDQ